MAWMTEVNTKINAIISAVNGVLAKLDDDGGVTDTNYEAVHGLSGSGACLPAADIDLSI